MNLTIVRYRERYTVSRIHMVLACGGDSSIHYKCIYTCVYIGMYICIYMYIYTEPEAEKAEDDVEEDQGHAWV